MGGSRVVGDPVYPGPQTTTSIVGGKAPPDRDVDLLEQILPFIRIRFITPGEALERPVVGGDGVVIEAVAILPYLR
jgi:hypothetical protein